LARDRWRCRDQHTGREKDQEDVSNVHLLPPVLTQTEQVAGLAAEVDIMIETNGFSGVNYDFKTFILPDSSPQKKGISFSQQNAMKTDFTFEESENGVCIGGSWENGTEQSIPTHSPIDGTLLSRVSEPGRDQYDRMVNTARSAFDDWSQVPAPERGEMVRELGNRLRDRKEDLARLITRENGKILEEARGEVQEAIDIADYAVGLSRQLYGKTTHSERPNHRLYEQWHPLGITAIITAFNFPVAVWAWNAMISAVCGNSMIWKPSPKTPLCSIAVQTICNDVFEDAGHPGVLNLGIGTGQRMGDWIARDKNIPLVSATGSCEMGRSVAEKVHSRLGRTILELGGNNAAIVTPDADLDLALRSVVFGAAGTTGQRCTTTRRLIVQESIVDHFTDQLIDSYQQLNIGNPFNEDVHVGPLINQEAVDTYKTALETIQDQGGNILYGGTVLEGDEYDNGFYVEPTLVRAEPSMPIIKQETFGPILYILSYNSIEDAIRIHNDVPQGLSSALFSTNLREVEQFLSARGSDCGIANVNTGTSGAEIGLAFGGEKETGGGREAGSDSWKSYMRRQTNTINWGDDLPLAQGIDFGPDTS
jgi:aldehyde dehydrogenase (NAD+)